MSALDRYVLRRFFAVFFPTCFGFGFLFFVGGSYRLLRDADLSVQQILLAVPWLIPFLLPYLIPLALTTTVALVYGRLVADNEVLALGSLGIPARALCGPVIVAAALLSLTSAWTSAQLVPYCHRMKREATRAVFEQLLSLGEGEHLTRSFPKQSFSLYVRRYVPGSLEGIVLHYTYTAGDEGRRVPIQVVAERGRIAAESQSQELVLVLGDVTVTALPDAESDDPDAGPLRATLEHVVQGISLGSYTRRKVFDFSSPELRLEAQRARDDQGVAAALGGGAAVLGSFSDFRIEAEVELALRVTLAAAPLLVVLIVLPITFLLRARSALIPFLAGTAATLALYFTPLLLGRSMAESIDTAAGVYGAIVCSLAGAAALAYAAARRG